MPSSSNHPGGAPSPSAPQSPEETTRAAAVAAAQAIVLAQRETNAANAEARFKFWTRLLLRLALLALTAYVVWRTQAIIATVIVSMILASAIGAMVRPLMRLRLPGLRPRTQRTAATTAVFFLLFGGAGWMGYLLFQPFQQEWENLQRNWPAYQKTLEGVAAQAQVRYAALPQEAREYIEAGLKDVQVPSPATYVSAILGRTVSWAGHVVELVLIPVLAFYFALDARALRSEMLFLVPRGRLRSTLAILDEGGSIMRDYIIAQFWLAVIAGVFVGGGLALVGMQYALILGVFAAITRAIPVIGPLLGGVPIVAFTFLYGAQNNQPFLWIYVLVAFTLMHLVESKIIMPKFLGHRLHLHAVVILIALLVGGEFFGLMGMFLAAPLAALARVLIMHFLVLPRRRRERVAAAEAEAVQVALDEAGAPRLTVAQGGVAVATAGGASGGGGGRVLRLERALRAQAAASAGPAPTPPGPSLSPSPRAAVAPQQNAPAAITTSAEEERSA